jgi:UDP-galactopyranose mutase
LRAARFLQPNAGMIQGHTHSHTDLVCVSHLRWNFVFQRPQHLMTRCAQTRRVFFVEEPVFHASAEPRLCITKEGPVHVVVPNLPEGLNPRQIVDAQRRLLDDFLVQEHIDDFILWYYTPMALPFTRHWSPSAIVFDCMDELSGFMGASSDIKRHEEELLRRASLVLTGGQSLYEARRLKHHNIHLFPSSVDVKHFAQARRITMDPPDQSPIARPRLGYVGVIDERMNLPLVEGLADARPDWEIVLVGPVVKIDPATLPRRPNIHYLGGKAYADLPGYIAGWDVALMPFAKNDATRFISPTKTPEYLAAGKPVVSTSIKDVVHPYGVRGFVRIADTVSDFVSACEASMVAEPGRLKAVDDFLKTMSWDDTWSRIDALITRVLDGPGSARAVRTSGAELRV